MRRRTRAVILAGVMTFALSGCAAGAGDTSSLAELQRSVVDVADAAAAGDATAALAGADALQEQLTAALDAGTVTAERAARIQSALDTVRADLTALIPSPEESEAAVVDQPVVDQPVTEEPAVQEPAVQEPAVNQPAVEEPATKGPAGKGPAGNGPPGKGPANPADGPGKGPDNDKGKGKK